MILCLTAVPSVLGLVLNWRWLPESPRWLAHSGGTQAERAAKAARLRALLREVASANGKGALVRRLDAGEGLASVAPPSDKEHASGGHAPGGGGKGGDCGRAARLMFSPRHRALTLTLFVLWFVQSFVFYGILYVFPVELGRERSVSHRAQALQCLLSAALELPSIAFCYAAIDDPRVGRRGTLFWSMFACGGALLWCAGMPAAARAHWLGLASGLAKMLVNMSFSTIYPYTAELFPTDYRSSAVGFGSAASRLGGISAPFASEALLRRGVGWPYLAFSGVAALGAGAMLTPSMERETAGGALPGRASAAGGGGPRKLPRQPAARRSADDDFGLGDDEEYDDDESRSFLTRA